MGYSRKILGLDLGTNSIGWAVVEQNDDNFSLLDKGVRIFSEGVKSEKGVESSRAAERTSFRSARKIKYRRKLRKYETLKVLVKNNMVPLDMEELENYKKSGFQAYPMNDNFLNWLRTDDKLNKNPYAFRDAASRGKINPMDVGRALYHIAQRRGFLSGRLDQSGEGVLEENSPLLIGLIEDLDSLQDIKTVIQDFFDDKGIFDSSQKSGYISDADEGDKILIKLYKSLYAIVSKDTGDLEQTKNALIEKLSQKENLGAVKGAIHNLSTEMREKGFRTIGQLFHDKYSKSKIRKNYTSREEHYLSEFEIICKVQGIGKINEHEKLAEKRFEGLAKDLYRAIFYQRPLKSQKGLIGKCSFEPSKSRCAVSHPDFEALRMWNYLNTIKMGMRGEELRPLTKEQKELLVPKFFRKKEQFNFEDLAKELVPAKASFGYFKSSKKGEVEYWFNYQNNDSVAGCPVSASLRAVFGEDWNSTEFSYETLNAEGKKVSRKVDYHDLWHLLSTSTTDEYLYDFALNKLKLTEKQAKTFSKIRLKKDFGNLSLGAIRKILPYAQKGLLYSHAVFVANLGNVVDRSLWNDSKTREEIQNAIGKIIENHGLENDKIEALNGILKQMLNENGHYSEAAQPVFRDELKSKIKSILKKHKLDEQTDDLENELFPILVNQLKKEEFLKIDRIDDKVKAYLLGQSEEAQVFVSDEKRLKKMYHPSDIEKFKLKSVYDEENNFVRYELGSPISASIKNPMAMRAIHQLRKVLNTLIVEGKIDQNTHVHIEMARELNDANRRKGIQDYQKELKNKREEYRKEIKELYKAETNKDVEPTEDDILRYQLWIEQNKQEIYEPSINGGKSRTIGIAQIIGSNPDYDIEHTIPRSISQDNSQSNKTLCSKHFNREVKKNKMPTELQNFELILPFVEHWKREAEEIEKDINQLNKRIKASTTKEAKDKSIRKRHYLSLKKAYLEDKYNNFTRKEPKTGFKNSQIPDTGIITKYAQSYLRSYFKRVESVKGGMVAEFRKLWGIQKSFIDENGKKHYEEKDRSKHTHHTIDAITIACMTKPKYDILAHAWTLEDEGKLPEARRLIESSKPWKTFAEDIAKIEDEILVSHHTPDNLKKQSKKIMRVRGKKQFVAEMTTDENGKRVPKKDAKGKIVYKLDEKGQKIPRLQQGDTVRGSLHQDSIYGRVIDPETKEIRSVIRKSLESLKVSDIEKIVDPEVREIVKKAVADKVLLLSSNAQQANKLTGTVWMNEAKGIAINKVRIYADSVKNPLQIKKHAELSKSRHPHKQFVLSQNDENYCMALYEGLDKKGNTKRAFELVSNLDAGSFYKSSNFRRGGQSSLVPEVCVNSQLPIKVILRKGDLVLFYEKNLEELWDISKDNLTKRLYKVIGFESDGRVQFRINGTAMQQSSMNVDEMTIVKYMRDNNIKNSVIDFNNPAPWLRLSQGNLNFIVQNLDFTFSSTGKIERLR